MMVQDRSKQAEMVKDSMATLLQAHESVGGPIVSAGGTGTFDINNWATEIQAGSYLFMDTDYAKLGLPFSECLSAISRVISCLLYTSPSPRDKRQSRMPSSA